MMVPTLIIITDNNEKLNALGIEMEGIVRVIKRTSYEGEKLYNTFEGIRFIDGQNKPVMAFGDNWRNEDIQKRIGQVLKKSPEQIINLLKSYLRENGKELNKLEYFLKTGKTKLQEGSVVVRSL